MQRRQRVSMARSSGTAILGAALALPAGAVRADVLPVNEPLSASTGGGVMAAADEDAAETGLTDVVVTATRQSTILQRTPVAVTVVTSADIAEQNVTTTRDLAGLVPGVTIVRSGITPLTQVFFIRGIGESGPIFDPATAT